MRKIIIAGNWKMYKCKDEALDFVFKINNMVPDKNIVDTVIFPQITLLDTLTKIEGENLRIGAQNVFYLEEGPYTGEISPLNLVSLGVKYVLLGHSERKKFFGETDEIVNLKLLSVLSYSIHPIICLGGDNESADKEKNKILLKNQLEKIFKNVNISLIKKIIFAYEPIWAIGTGINMFPQEANDIIKYIREQIAFKFSLEISQKIRIIYGGSINIKNIDSFLKQEEIDGILAGKSSLKVEDFLYFTKIATNKNYLL
ncbi:triose-phosphate isomerase [Candidatus Phytoplasma pini]|uniref:Triosephosphate isomerase n=1 Tax=Candidatus Phytoplasma pini TaxID=267362 RepID=A0A559KJV4_9MOLU|nr:triose-phosphate isomerase [Candidatus Phytoplasma pini]TVY12410.1 triosephosphate isomerase [Candidatus Phytoplasma pini]